MVEHNKTALVTGASRGIGRATAAALARAGAHVLVHYGRSAREAESLVSEIQAEGGLANAISADLGTPNGAALLGKQVRSIVGDRLDVLVLNAGISKAARLADYTVEDFDNLFAQPRHAEGVGLRSASDESGLYAGQRAHWERSLDRKLHSHAQFGHGGPVRHADLERERFVISDHFPGGGGGARHQRFRQTVTNDHLHSVCRRSLRPLRDDNNGDGALNGGH